MSIGHVMEFILYVNNVNHTVCGIIFPTRYRISAGFWNYSHLALFVRRIYDFLMRFFFFNDITIFLDLHLLQQHFVFVLNLFGATVYFDNKINNIYNMLLICFTPERQND